MTTLRDLKPGDSGTMEFTVQPSNFTGNHALVIIGGEFRWVSKSTPVTKLPPRARPVRKGDEIVDVDDPEEPCVFLAVEFADDKFTVYYRAANNPKPFMGGRGDFTHADGAPIDWEASE